MADRYVSIPTAFGDLESRDTRINFFQADLRNNAGTVSRRTTKFACGKDVFLGGHRRPYRKWAGPKRSPILGFLLFIQTPFDAELSNFPR